MRLSLKGGRQVCCAYLHAAGVCKVIVILALSLARRCVFLIMVRGRLTRFGGVS